MHLSDPQIEAFIAKSTAASKTSALDKDARIHLRGCAECSARLAREAATEQLMLELCERTDFCVACGHAAEDRCARCGAYARVRGYEILEVMVENSHGRIYVARDQAGHKVALKELAFVQTPSGEDIDAFEREARVLRKLNHPAIPKFIDSFQVGEGVHTRLYLAQEFIDGQSLEEISHRHQYSEAEARDIALQTLDILVYLQSLSPMVFHRDVKPANLVRDTSGKIYLVDFGAARLLGATASATLVGTFGYMPVEQLGGIVDATSDVYALGASLIQLLSGREPWKLLEDRTFLRKLNVSDRFRQLLAKMVAARSEDRFRDANAAEQALLRDQIERFSVRRLLSRLGGYLAPALIPRPGFALALVAMMGLFFVLFLQNASDEDVARDPVAGPERVISSKHAARESEQTQPFPSPAERSRGVINAVVAANRDRIADCNRLSRYRINVTFTIQSDGYVGDVSTDKEGTTADCIAAVIRSLRFSSGYEPSKVTYPFLLEWSE